MFLVSSCSCLCSIHWSQVFSWDWRCSWSSANRWCSNYIWVINNFIAYQGATYIRGFTIVLPSQWTVKSTWCNRIWPCHRCLHLHSRYSGHTAHHLILENKEGKHYISTRTAGSVFHHWLSKVTANERRCYACTVFSHWLWLCTAIDRKWALVWWKFTINISSGTYPGRWVWYHVTAWLAGTLPTPSFLATSRHAHRAELAVVLDSSGVKPSEM